MTDEQIITREFLRAVNDDCLITVELLSDEEAIRVTYRTNVFYCDCDSDEEFRFVCLNAPRDDVVFAIPADFHPERFA